jgi:hypothetical protein
VRSICTIDTQQRETVYVPNMRDMPIFSPCVSESHKIVSRFGVGKCFLWLSVRPTKMITKERIVDVVQDVQKCDILKSETE